jgi:hypothetical protein
MSEIQPGTFFAPVLDVIIIDQNLCGRKIKAQANPHELVVSTVTVSVGCGPVSLLKYKKLKGVRYMYDPVTCDPVPVTCDHTWTSQLPVLKPKLVEM